MNGMILNQMALALREDGTYAPFSGEAWAFAGKMTLMGMCMVFAVLALLWGILAIFKLIFTGRATKTTQKSEASAVAQREKTASVAESAPADSQTDGTELIAVLSAAVAAYREQEGCTGEFRVVSFKRANGGRSWNAKR